MDDVRSDAVDGVADQLARPRGADDVVTRLPIAMGLLPEVVHDTPAAVLLVDLTRGEVTFANSLASQLAPGMSLPLSIDDWSRAAGLRDVGGDDLAGDLGDAERPGRGQPLSRVARGEPVMGEAVTAARAGGGFARREPLWVVGLPLDDAPGPLAQQALVIFLPLRHTTAVSSAQQSAASLRDRAVLATDLAFTITDPRLPDNPLVWVNPAFLAATGYTSEQVVDRNCRFLQGPDTDRDVVAQIRAAVVAGEAVTTTLLNYRADGSQFWNQLSLSPILDAGGVVTHYVGIQIDVSERVRSDREREQALHRAQVASARLGLLAATTNRLSASLDPAEIVELMSELVVPQLGSWTETYLVDGRGRVASAHVHHPDAAHDPAVRALIEELSAYDVDLPDDHPATIVARGEAASVLIRDVEQRRLAGGMSVDEQARAQRDRLGARSGVYVPITARGRVLGVFSVVNDVSRGEYTDDDVAVMADLAARAGLALDNARLFAREHQAAETLQRALLPVVPDLDDVEVSAQYLPATARNAVGGDWYDVLRLRDDRSVGIAVGDVMGHDLSAAAAMGQLRSVLRSYAYPGARPAAVLEQLDQLVQSLGMGSLATCVYGRLSWDDVVPGSDQQDPEFLWANAGHPPPLLLTPDGQVRLLTTSASRIVGVPFHQDVERTFPTPAVRDEGRVRVPRGSVLLLYTDGLVEDRVSDIDSGIEQLRRFVQEQDRGLGTAELVERMTARRALDDRDDDIAVLAVRVR